MPSQHAPEPFKGSRLKTKAPIGVVNIRQIRLYQDTVDLYLFKQDTAQWSKMKISIANTIIYANSSILPRQRTVRNNLTCGWLYLTESSVNLVKVVIFLLYMFKIFDARDINKIHYNNYIYQVYFSFLLIYNSVVIYPCIFVSSSITERF